MGNYSIEDHVISIEKFQSDSRQRLAWNIAQAIDATEVHLSPRHCNIKLIEEQDQYEDEKQCVHKVHVEDAELQDSGRDDDTSSATEDSGQENLESDQRSNLEFEGSKEEQSAPQFDDSGYAEMSLDFQFAKLMHRGKPVLFNFRDLSFISFYEKWLPLSLLSCNGTRCSYFLAQSPTCNGVHTDAMLTCVQGYSIAAHAGPAPPA